MRYDRDDDFMITGKRHDFRIDYRVGFNAEGRIGDRFHPLHALRLGDGPVLAGGRPGDAACGQCLFPARRAHRKPPPAHHTQSATAFRGFGGPQGMLGIERVMDHIAHHLRLDPLSVRQANYYAESADRGALPPSGLRPAPQRISGKMTGQVTPYGQEVEDFILHAMTDDLATRADYSARRAAIAAWNRKNPVLKRGIALTPVKFGISFTLTHLNQAGALVHVYQDGSVQLNHGGTEMGQGLFQKVAQVAAAAFGIDVARVRITATDTGKVPNTSATAASSGSDLNGMAVKAACDTIRDRLADLLAQRHQCQPADVVFEGGMVRVPEAAFPFDEVVALAYLARVSLSSTGYYRTPKLEWDRLRGQGRPFLYFAYGVSCTEVVIDTLTGENRILRADILHDCGASLNPALDIGQIEGGYVQGAGWLTTEELVWDGRGRLRTHAPSTYKIPAMGDRPRQFNVHLWNGQNTEETIHRSKAVGEPPFMHGISVLMALSDAVAACGDGGIYPALDAPATPERILAAVARQQEGRG
jgi:xanthine dehydrogenase large subunit